MIAVTKTALIIACICAAVLLLFVAGAFHGQGVRRERRKNAKVAQSKNALIRCQQRQIANMKYQRDKAPVEHIIHEMRGA